MKFQLLFNKLYKTDSKTDFHLLWFRSDMWFASVFGKKAFFGLFWLFRCSVLLFTIDKKCTQLIVKKIYNKNTLKVPKIHLKLPRVDLKRGRLKRGLIWYSTFSHAYVYTFWMLYTLHYKHLCMIFARFWSFEVKKKDLKSISAIYY